MGDKDKCGIEGGQILVPRDEVFATVVGHTNRRQCNSLLKCRGEISSTRRSLGLLDISKENTRDDDEDAMNILAVEVLLASDCRCGFPSGWWLGSTPQHTAYSARRLD